MEIEFQMISKLHIFSVRIKLGHSIFSVFSIGKWAKPSQSVGRNTEKKWNGLSILVHFRFFRLCSVPLLEYRRLSTNNAMAITIISKEALLRIKEKVS